jgi:hypothetical protein
VRLRHVGANLDLRTQELGAHHAVTAARAGLDQLGRRIGREIAALRIDEEILLLDADREDRLVIAQSTYPRSGCVRPGPVRPLLSGAAPAASGLPFPGRRGGSA